MDSHQHITYKIKAVPQNLFACAKRSKLSIEDNLKESYVNISQLQDCGLIVENKPEIKTEDQILCCQY